MPPKYLPLEAFGFKTQAPRWVLASLGVILVIAIGWTLYMKVYADPERTLISLKDANKQLAAEVEEYSLHAMEEPQKHELFEEQDGKLILRVFKDHCVLIQRTTVRGTRTKLVPDLARSPLTATRFSPAHERGISWLPVVEAAQTPPGCQRGCRDPHPGEFRWWYGKQTQSGWVEVWRQWPEGCLHWQMFHPQTGSWESNPDGSARVHWVCCVH